MRILLSFLLLGGAICLNLNTASADSAPASGRAESAVSNDEVAALEALSQNQLELYNLIQNGFISTSSCQGSQCSHPNNSECKCTGSASCTVQGTGSGAKVICKSNTKTTTCTYVNGNCDCSTV